MRKTAIAAMVVGLLGSATPGFQTPQPGMVVSTAWLAAHLDDSTVAVITTGERSIYDRGHIPGARFIGHDEMLGPDHRLLEAGTLAAILARAGARDEARVVLYGESAMTTGWLFMALAALGHAGHVSMLDGNIDAWRADGHRVETVQPRAATGRLSVRPAPDVIVDAPWVRQRLEDPKVCLIDARTTREWNQGRLPGATLVLWQDLFADLNQLRFKPRDEIRAMLERAGAAPGREVVTYCAVGMRASLMYFAALHAGFPARVYVGSYEDWRRQGDAPIVR
ncbi:MAG TPA: rhodanese-like domain-containing protein [Vicinamibacterales bacterium]|nr:rhodanese-like domain-containing protein [Vicinamibacterales bacterium]